MKIILFICLLLLSSIFGWAYYSNQTTNTLPQQQVFVENSYFSNSLPYGDYTGETTAWFAGAWEGKRFSQEQDTGVNIYKNPLSPYEDLRYPFTIREGTSLENQDKKVIVLDYNVPENPYWIRFLREEMVELEDGTYVGKTLYVIVQQYPIAISFFTLRK